MLNRLRRLMHLTCRSTIATCPTCKHAFHIGTCKHIISFDCSQLADGSAIAGGHKYCKCAGSQNLR